MSRDDLKHAGPDHPDDGMIHEWLDGQLDADESARLEALVAASPVFAARVADARGVLAAASRILGALDDVPGGVLPAGDAVRGALDDMPGGVLPAGGAVRGGEPDVIDIGRAARGAPVRRSWRRWGSIAALLMVGVTGIVLSRDGWLGDDVSVPVSDAVSLEAPSTMPLPEASPLPPEAVARPVAPEPTAVAGARAAGASVAGTPAPPPRAQALRDEAAEAARAKAGRAGSAAPGEAAKALATDDRARRGADPGPPAAVLASPPRVVPSPDSLRSPVERTGERVAADPAQRPTLQVPAAPPSPMSAAARGFEARQDAARDAEEMRGLGQTAVFAEVASDIPSDALALAVQRVQCAPVCRQVRLEFATDGRLRRWVQAMGTRAPADTGRTAAADIDTLARLVDSLALADLPAMLRLDGGKCASVGALRESLRVEFRQGGTGTLRSVMGLPWCTDGTHALDQVARAAEALVDRRLGPVRD